MKFKHILFDLDGTLTDPFSGITKSVRYSLAKFGIDSGVSHFYINRMSYSFRNDGAFCLQKIFLKR